jgi:hypothetical protein
MTLKQIKSIKIIDCEIQGDILLQWYLYSTIMNLCISCFLILFVWFQMVFSVDLQYFQFFAENFAIIILTSYLKVTFVADTGRVTV